MGLNRIHHPRKVKINTVLPTYVGLNPDDDDDPFMERSVLPTYVGLNPNLLDPLFG